MDNGTATEVAIPGAVFPVATRGSGEDGPAGARTGRNSLSGLSGRDCSSAWSPRVSGGAGVAIPGAVFPVATLRVRMFVPINIRSQFPERSFRSRQALFDQIIQERVRSQFPERSFRSRRTPENSGPGRVVRRNSLSGLSGRDSWTRGAMPGTPRVAIPGAVFPVATERRRRRQHHGRVAIPGAVFPVATGLERLDLSRLAWVGESQFPERSFRSRR